MVERGFEVCSPGEFRICERLGIPMGKVVMSGVYKNPADLERVLDCWGSGLTYTVESPRQWQLIREGPPTGACR